VTRKTALALLTGGLFGQALSGQGRGEVARLKGGAVSMEAEKGYAKCLMNKQAALRSDGGLYFGCVRPEPDRSRMEIYLDHIEAVDVIYKGRTVSIPADEIWEALKPVILDPHVRYQPAGGDRTDGGGGRHDCPYGDNVPMLCDTRLRVVHP